MSESNKVVFEEPAEFHYANSFRVYGSDTEVIVEFARSRPNAPGGEPTAVKGVVGVVINTRAAKNLIDQISHAIHVAQANPPVVITNVPPPTTGAHSS